MGLRWSRLTWHPLLETLVLTPQPSTTPLRDPARITAVVVVNPRPEMPQHDGPSRTLERYAAMKGQGCDVSLAFVRLPCSESDSQRCVEQVASETRSIKLSPETVILRLVAMLVCQLFGVRRRLRPRQTPHTARCQ